MTNEFYPIGKAIMRIPHYPIEVARLCLESDNFFISIIQSSYFRNALYIASPELLSQLDKYLDNKLCEKKCKKMKLTLYKYIMRMSTRCTPFGLFATCSVCNIEDMHKIIVSDTIKKHVRLDMHYISNLCYQLNGVDKIIESQRYIKNSTIYSIGSFFRFIRYKTTPTGRAYYISELKKTRMLIYLLRKADNFMSFQALVDSLLNEYCISEADAKLYIKNLIRSMILIGAIMPSVSGTDALEYIIQQISNCDETKHQQLKIIKHDINSIAAGSIDHEIISKCSKAVSSIADLGIQYNRKYLLQLDSFRDLKCNSVSSSIINQLYSCMNLLRIITPTYINPKIQDFKKRFYMRYELQEIPLLEALDADIGVGYGDFYEKMDCPLLNSLKIPKFQKTSGSLYLSPIAKILQKQLSSIKNNILTLRVSDFENCDQIHLPLPHSIAAMFSILSIVNDQKYIISNLRFVGSTGANMLGRFAYGSEDIYSILKKVAYHEQLLEKDAIIAEIIHIPESRTGNILHRPHFREFEIQYLSGSDNDITTVKSIPVSDILVSIRNNKIVLRSKKYNKLIVPRLTTAHNYASNPTPVYNFLCEMQMQDVQPMLAFSWHGLDQLYTSLPRVVYQDVILEPAKWYISSNEIKNLSQSFYHDWINRNNLPENVLIVSGDNKLFVDLNNKYTLSILKEEAKHKSVIILEEFLQSESVVVDSERKSYMNEFIIPFIKRYEP